MQEGTVIPAHPLALNADRQLDEARQRALTRYYLDAGAGGVAVGVHTTQFEIRKPEYALLEPVLKIASEEVERARPSRSFIKVAGICGPPAQALEEAGLALRHGFDLGLVSMAGLDNYPEKAVIRHVADISEQIPVFGFYLQPAVGGRVFSYEFWQEFAEIPGVQAIKVAAFNRYHTLDVVRAVCCSSRKNEIALYTGNDDNIVADLLTPYRFKVKGEVLEKRFAGGLLGHWAVWTKKAVELLDAAGHCIRNDYQGAEALLRTGIEVTDMNAAVFDSRNSFRGCIPGIHEVLRRQGLLEGLWCLDPGEKLSPGQLGEIDRVMEWYPHLTERSDDGQ